MPRLRRLSGEKVIGILGEFGFSVHSQRGSHVKLKRLRAGPGMGRKTAVRGEPVEP